MNAYRCYGLALLSEIPLPELVPGDPEREPDSAAIRILNRPVPPEGLPDSGRQLGPYLWANQDELWLRVPGVARYWVRNGQEILIDAEAGVDEDSVRVFLLGSALGALLFQRGLLVLHGNAIRVGDQCLVCVGPSGAGKSTLAAGFLKRGYGILADDVVPVDSECRALPGFPRIKLWRDAADALSIDTHPLRRIRPQLEKFNVPLDRQDLGQGLPVRWVYILKSHEQPDFRFEPIRGMARFLPLRNNTYRVRFLEGLALKGAHLALCGTLAGRIRLASITRPDRGFELDPLIDRILADIAAHP